MKELAMLRQQIDAEIGMAGELAGFVKRFEHALPEERALLSNMIKSLKQRLRLANNSVKELTQTISLAQKLPAQRPQETTVEPIATGNRGERITVRSRDKRQFLKELHINESLVRKLRKRERVSEEKPREFKKTSLYGKLSNKFFLRTSTEWVKKGKFKTLRLDLRRSNLNILTTTYLSMMMFSIFLSIFIGFGIFVLLLVFTVGLNFPFVTFYSGDVIARALSVFWIVLIAPLVTWIAFYFYPGAERRSLGKKIDQELPFAVIHMASVSGSGLEPSEIFKILGSSKEYKYTQKEITKILNQTNIYGYDLTNALRTVALATPSAKLAELLNGISIAINSGGDIQSFFEKRAESLLLEYRLEREKFTKTAETFMDIYISIVIAAPMILLMLLVMISVSGIQTGFNINQMTFAIIGVIAIINILFLTFLNLKQPAY